MISTIVMSKLKTKREAGTNDELELDERFVDDDEFVTSDDLKLSKGSHGSYQPKHAEHKFDNRISTAMIVRDQHERKQQSEQETASEICSQKQAQDRKYKACPSSCFWTDWRGPNRKYDEKTKASARRRSKF